MTLRGSQPSTSASRNPFEFPIDQPADFVGFDSGAVGFVQDRPQPVADHMLPCGPARLGGVGRDRQPRAADRHDDPLRLQLAIRAGDGVGVGPALTVRRYAPLAQPVP